MRKIITLFAIAALSVGAAMAQGISFKVQDKVYESGSTVTVKAEAQFFDFGDGPEFDALEAYPHLCIIPAEDGAYAMSMEITASTGTWTGMWCGFGNGAPMGSGTCKSFKDILDPTADGSAPYELNGGSEYDCEVHFAYGGYELPTSVVDCTCVVKAWNFETPENVASITIISKYDPNDVGVKAVENDGMSFNGKEVSAPGMDINIYNLNGVLVSDTRDNANLSNLPAGIYVVKAGNTVRKFAIK